MARKRIVAVDVGTSSVKVAEVALGPNGYRVTRVGSADVDPDIPSFEACAVREAMGDAGIRRGECVVSVPRHQVVSRRLAHLPAHLEGERLRDVVRIQAEAELPFGANEAVFDFYDVRHLESSTSVELVAAKRESVEALVKVVREAGLRPVFVVPSVFGTAALARLHQTANASPKRLVILNVGGSNTDVVVMRGEYFAFSRSFPVGAESFRLSPTESVPRFRAEIRRTLQSYQREFMENGKESLEEIWLWGGGATSVFQSDEHEEMSLATLLEAELNIPATIWTEVKGFDEASLVEAMPGGWARVGIAVGLAVGALEGTLGVNLIPREVQEKKVQRAQGRRFLAAAGGCVALIAAILGVSGTVEGRLRASLSELERQHQAIRLPKTKATQTLGEIRALAELAKRRYSVLDVLRELTALLPERQDVAVTVLSVEKGGKITVNLEASSHGAVSQAVKRIGESAWFVNVLPGQITTTQKENRLIRQLTVTFRLAADADTLAARGVWTPVTELPETVAQGGPSREVPRAEGEPLRGQGPLREGGVPFPPGGVSPGSSPPPPGGSPRQGEGGLGPVVRPEEEGRASPPSGEVEPIRVYRIENVESSR